jgi:hypothetical protein
MPKEPESAATEDAAKIWLDKPPEHLALGFDGIADGLTEIISESEPCFAIGIFGGWGSGKTTLMQAIQRRLESRGVLENPKRIFIGVNFNAWRFEREPSLLVPLLDTIRDSLAKWAKRPGADQGVKEAARKMGRVVRGLAAGLSAEVGVPGAVKIGYDLDKGMSEMRRVTETGRRDKPQSLYVAAFAELSEAIEKLDKAIRVVVFVDDLDRCMEWNALEVLESMKLFFDLRGFIFVVGVDEIAIQRAVRARLSGSGHAAAGPSTGGAGLGVTTRPEAEQDYLEKSESEYLDKIIQVTYRLPQATTRELAKLLTTMSEEDAAAGALPDPPLVAKYLRHIAVNDRINPRAVKKFLNVYTLRTRATTRTTTTKKREPKAVLALQVLEFRYDWQGLYKKILFDWRFFKEALKKFRKGDYSAFEDLSGDLRVLPSDLGRFLQSGEAEILADENTDIGLLLSGPDAEASDTAGLDEIYRSFWHLRDEVREVLKSSRLQVEDRKRLAGLAEAFYVNKNLAITPGSSFDIVIQQLEDRTKELKGIEPADTESYNAPEDKFRADVKDITEEIFKIVERIRDELRASTEPAIPAAVPVAIPAAVPVPAGSPDRASYAAAVMNIVAGALPDGWHLHREEREVEASRHRFDGLIESESGTKTIAVEAFYSASFTGGTVSRALTRAYRERKVDAALVVAVSGTAPGFRRLEGDCTALDLPHQILEWQPEQQDDLILTGAVRDLIRTVQRNGRPA